MSEPRTARAMQELAEAVDADMRDITDTLSGAYEAMRALEGVVGPLNGLAGVLRARGNELEQTIRTLTEESESARRKLLPSARAETSKPGSDPGVTLTTIGR